MLLDDDLALASRDAALPRLVEFLDPEWLRGELASQVGIPVSALNLHQTTIRYKPATSCLVGYAGSVANHPLMLYARLHHPEQREKARKPICNATAASCLGPPALFLEQACVVVMLYPNDHELRFLPQLETMGEHLQKNLVSDLPALEPWRKTRVASLTCLRYKPERRYVGKISFADRRALVLKLYARRFQPGLPVPSGLHLAAGQGFSFADWLGWSRSARMAALAWVEGTSLNTCMNQRPELVAEVGRCLATFHLHTLDHAPAMDQPRWNPQSLMDHAESSSHIAPSLSVHLQSLLHTVLNHDGLACLFPTSHHCQIHGDFSADQVVVGSDRLTLIDLDRSRYDSPLHDLGTFIARLEFDALFSSDPARGRSEVIRLSRELIAGYRSVLALPLDGCISLVTALHLLALLQEPFRLRWPHWLAAMAAVLQLVETILVTGDDAFL